MVPPGPPADAVAWPLAEAASCAKAGARLANRREDASRSRGLGLLISNFILALPLGAWDNQLLSSTKPPALLQK
jgi:hypothetical protein